ncbi:MAG: O-antigen ligase family protein [Chloroflexota bacterium]|nr:O-antigen ligase family protein [Chloroflexota bacterium]
MRNATSISLPPPVRGYLPATLLLGSLALAVTAGIAIAAGAPELGIAIALAIPMVTLVLRYPWAAVLIWLTVMPFFVVSPDGTAGPGVWLVHRLLVPMVVLVALVYRTLGLSRSHFRLSLTDMAIAAFLLLGYANIALLTGNPVRMSVAFYDDLVIPIAMYWLVRLIEPRDDDLRRMVPIMIGLILVQFSIGLLSWVAPAVLPDFWLGRAGERTVGTLRGPGAYTVTLVFSSLIVLRRATMVRYALDRIVLLGIVAAGFYGVVLSFSRGSWLGAAVVVAGVFVLHRRLSLQFLALTAVLAIAMAAGPLGNQINFAAERLGDASTADSRLVTDNAAVRMIEARPVLGFGYGNFERSSEEYKERLGDIPVAPGSSSHHAYLAFAAENGLPALIAYLFPAAWLLILTFRRWWRVPRVGFMNRALLVFLWLVIADEFIVSNFTDLLHSNPWSTTLWWMSLGLIHVVLTRASLPAAARPMAIRPVDPEPGTIGRVG